MRSQAIDIAVIILTCNQRDVTIRCLSSFENVDRDGVEILVWDNGSSDGTKTAIENQFPSVKVCRSDQNLGAAGGRNAGAREAIKMWNPEYLFFIDNDTKVTPKLTKKLSYPLRKSSEIGITVPKVRLMNAPERIDVAGGCDVQIWLGQTSVIGHGEIDNGQYNDKQDCIPGGPAMMTRTDTFDKTGGFDVGFDPYGFEDLDFSLRMKEAGYRCVYIPQAILYHSPTQTFEGGEYSPEYARQKAKNWHRFVQRHASPVEKAGFWLIGVPVRLLEAFVREARRGNLGAVAALLSGGWNLVFGSSDQR